MDAQTFGQLPVSSYPRTKMGMQFTRRRTTLFFFGFLATFVCATLVLLRRDNEGFLRPAKLGLDNILHHKSELEVQTQDIFQHPSWPYLEPEIETQTQILDLTHLEKHDLTPEFRYSRREIRTKHFDGKRKTLTKINEPLFNTPRTLDVEELWNRNATINVQPPLTLEVPSSPKVDTSIISFGIATTAARLPAAFPNLEHWLSNTSSPLHVIVADSEGNEPADLESQLQDRAIRANIANTSLPFSKAYFSLIRELYESRTPETRWIVLIDDDTFIPSLPALLNHLAATYDPTRELIISAETDNIDQIRIFGIQPFGGGGIFLSVPLAASLSKPEIFESCMNSTSNQGDQITNECLEAYSPVRPTFDVGLNQMDIHGSFYEPAGYFESGRPMLTIHHWRSWFHIDMPAVARVSKACGDEGILMRWLFDGDVVLSNGYSVAEYPKGISDEELRGVELTWSDAKKKYIHRIGPLRENLGIDRKRALGMVETVVLEEGVRQTYLELAEEEDGKPVEMDKVVELLWLFE